MRKALKMTQPDFGRELGVSKDVIGHIEYGRVEPRAVFLEHMCYIFNANMEWLLHGEGEMFYVSGPNEEELVEALDMFSKLKPKLKIYAHQQIKELLDVQDMTTMNHCSDSGDCPLMR